MRIQRENKIKGLISQILVSSGFIKIGLIPIFMAFMVELIHKIH